MRLLTTFTGDPGEPSWEALDDTVMGGLSHSEPVIDAGTLVFHGELSLENNGGFASVRTADREFDLGGAEMVVLRVRGDGRDYQLRLATEAMHRGIRVSYGGGFSTVAGQWLTVRVPLDTLQPTARGKPLDGPAFEPTQVQEIGLLIGDKRDGAFSLEVEWIGVE